MADNILETLDLRILGSELRAARVRRGMTQEAAAKLIGVARTTLVAIEKGERRIRPEELVTLAHGYDRQVSEFVRQRPQIDAFEPQFRGPVAPSAKDEDEIAPWVHTLEDLCRNYLELEELLYSPLRRNYPLEYAVKGIPIQQAAESIALEERNRLGIGDGPIRNLRQILEQDVGLRIFYLPMPARYSEIYIYTEQLGGCLAINSSHPEERRRWSLSHGYLHFLAHRHRAVASASDAYLRKPESEHFADAFAMYWLLPTAGLLRRFNGIRQSKGKVTAVDFYTLAHFYGVSVEALVLRLEALRLVPAGLWDELKRRGMRIRDLQARAGLDPQPAQADRYPFRYQCLAVEALDRELITEGQFDRFLEVERVEGRRLAGALRQEGAGAADSIGILASNARGVMTEEKVNIDMDTELRLLDATAAEEAEDIRGEHHRP